MSNEMRIGERVEITGTVETYLPAQDRSWELNGYDVSPTALAVIVPVQHRAMKALDLLFKPGNQLIVSHEQFGSEKSVLHRVFRHRGQNTKWVLSFLHRADLLSNS